MTIRLGREGTEFLKYEIRELVDTAQKIKELDPQWSMIPENIGDPIPKGWPVPDFLREMIKNEADNPTNSAYGYTHSRGLPETRKWVAQLSKELSPSSNLDYEYVVFTSGLGAAIAVIYAMMGQGARTLQPTPGYPTHVSLESFSQGSAPILYKLDPENDWQPDFDDMEAKLTAHPDIRSLLVINPNNPTGAVYSEETLEKMVALAQKYKLMLISDEVYFRMVYNGHHFAQITEIAAGRVPLIVMRGLSKDVPWPGGRCGWLEFHNTELDSDFKSYCDGIKKKILMEVCSVTLPQHLAPKIYTHPDYPAWIENYNRELQENGNMIAELLGEVPYLKVNRTNGAFYMMPLFREGLLNERQVLPIANPAVREYVEKAVNVPNFPLDKRFAYYVLAATGICIVPASGFFSPYPGFRLTTLDRDPVRRKHTYETLAQCVREYIESAT